MYTPLLVKSQFYVPLPVAKIEHLSAEQTYGLTIEGDASHVTMGIVTHNTGTVTGRISSGGSREGAETPTVNFQNVVGDQHVENMMVSDTGWMEIYQAWKDQSDDAWWESFLDRYVYLKFDYKQNELRFLAQSSGDEALIETFRSGKKIFTLKWGMN